MTQQEVERLAALEAWFKQFHEYVGARRRGMDVTGDWPGLCQMYDESKPAFDAIDGGDQLPIELIVSVQDTTDGISADHHLTIGGVSVPCELTLLDER